MMVENISVDILLPTYNGEVYLEEQIRSILNQSYKNLRLIIRDDKSTDTTPDILQRLRNEDSRILLVENTEGNLGLVKSIEKLLGFSDAELIFFSDQDDVWMENKLEIFLREYSTADVPVLIHSNCLVTDQKLNVREPFFSGAPKRKGLENSLFNYFVQGASSMINARLKEVLLPFPDEVYIHDRYFHLAAEAAGRRIYIDEPTMWYRQHEKNLIGSQTLLKKIKNNLGFKKFYIDEDRKLINRLALCFPDNDLLKAYQELTSDRVSRFRKIGIITKNKIALRLKEKILLLLNN